MKQKYPKERKTPRPALPLDALPQESRASAGGPWPVAG